MLEIESGAARAVVEPALGGSLLAFTIGDIDITRRAQGASDPRDTSSFPMVPWVNRIDRGKFATSCLVEDFLRMPVLARLVQFQALPEARRRGMEPRRR